MFHSDLTAMEKLLAALVAVAFVLSLMARMTSRSLEQVSKERDWLRVKLGTTDMQMQALASENRLLNARIGEQQTIINQLHWWKQRFEVAMHNQNYRVLSEKERRQ